MDRVQRKFITWVMGIFFCFGGYFLKILPPVKQGTFFVFGASAFLLIILLMLISYYFKKWRNQLTTRVLLFALITGSTISILLYSKAIKDNAFYDNLENSYILKGKELSPAAEQYFKNHPEDNTSDERRYDSIGKYLPVWSSSSLESASTTLFISYIFLICSVSSCIFLLTNLLLEKEVAYGPSCK